MKYLRKFNTEDDVNMSVRPNVVLVANVGRVAYDTFDGVFIQHIDGTLYTTDEWTSGGFSNDEANGVAVGIGSLKAVIAKDEFKNVKWSSDTTNLVAGVAASEDRYTAEKDFNGRKNTIEIMKTDTSGAAYLCGTYIFPNGARGYLPALGEVAKLSKKSSEIRSAMSLIGGASMTNTTGYKIVTSTQRTATSVWQKSTLSGGTSSFQSSSKDYPYLTARPFTELL